MKSIQETLQQKEQEFKRLEVEIGILRAAQSILDEAGGVKEPQAAGASAPSPASSTSTAPTPAKKTDWVVSSLPSTGGAFNAGSTSDARTEPAPIDRPRVSFP
jgi:hypothetical protein